MGSTYVMHTASPFVIDEPNDENDLIKPAVEGTLSVMKACLTHKVKHCVVTSSADAIVNKKPENRPVDDKYNEEIWTDTDWEDLHTYGKSKTLAEKAAWNYVKSLSEKDKFALTVINPVLMVGPAWQSNEFASG